MENINIIRNSREKQNRTEKLVNLLLKTAIVVLGVIAAGEIVFQFVIGPRLKIQDIVIESDLGLSDAEILALAGIKRSDSFYSLNPDTVKEQILKNPLIREAYIEKQFPNTVSLVVRKRTPVAMVFIQDGGISIPAYVDRDGVVFHIGKSGNNEDYPVLSGIDVRDSETGISPGMQLSEVSLSEESLAGVKLPDSFKNFLGDLSVLKETSRTLYNFISEIKVVPAGSSGDDVAGVPPGSGDFELLFYMIPYTTKIRFGSSVNENSLTYAMLALDVLEQKGLSKTVKEIDFRSKAIVYRKDPIVYRKFQGGEDF